MRFEVQMHRCRASLLAAALILASHASAARASATVIDNRLTTPEALALPVERLVLPNGLVLLLAPDPTASSVLVWTTFRAGTLYEPAGRSGLAHLVEHVMASGPTPETDYFAILETRRARQLNAVTGTDLMSFQSVVPAEELPVAIWIAADRLGTLPGLLDAAFVEKERRIIAQERAVRVVDQPYGLVNEHLFGHLYPSPHPLHGGIVGDPAELGRCTLDDVRTFVADRLVPANGVVTVVGRFDPATARRLVEESLGGLPAGRRAVPPVFPRATLTFIDAKEEPLSRQPRVTLAWRIPDLPHDHAQALELGAQLLTYLTDGAWGMQIGAGLHEYAGESVFAMDVTIPYDEPMRAVHDDADAFLRLLTHREMPLEFFRAANLALDRMAIFGLDTLAGRAEVITRLELVAETRQSVADYLGAHWELDPVAIRDVARAYLKGARLVLHARPTRPRSARVERE
jgi:predicted Zn-dependent peptidase